MDLDIGANFSDNITSWLSAALETTPSESLSYYALFQINTYIYMQMYISILYI